MYAVCAVVVGMGAVPEGMHLRVVAGRVPECVVVRCVLCMRLYGMRRLEAFTRK